MSQLDTWKDAKVYIAVVSGDTDNPEAQPDALDQSGFEGLTWQEIGGVGRVPSLSAEDNFIEYPTVSDDVVQQQKGLTRGRSETIEYRRIGDDDGQIALRAAGATKNLYAIKLEPEDKPDAGGTNSARYARCLIGRPYEQGGRNEDFILETAQIVPQEIPIVVEATAGS